MGSGKGIQSYSSIHICADQETESRKPEGDWVHPPSRSNSMYCCTLKKIGKGLRQVVKVYGLNIAKTMTFNTLIMKTSLSIPLKQYGSFKAFLTRKSVSKAAPIFQYFPGA